MQFARINEIVLHYQVIGAPEGRPTLVFCNSLGTDFRIWRDVAVQLAGEVNIITYDKRGHGLSDAPPAPYSIDDHVGDLAGLLEHLEISDAIICGLSVGGQVAQGLVSSRPDLVRALILCDTAHKVGTDDMWNARIAQAESDGIAAMSDAILERWFSSAYCRADNVDLSGYRNMLVRQPLAGYVGTCAALRDADFTVEAGKILVPTLCVVGSNDGVTPPALVEELAGLIPNAEFEIIAGAGHLPCVENPKELSTLIRGFIARLPGAGE